VKNIGEQTFSGEATTDAPFSIIAGGTYTLSPGQSQSVTVAFTPPSLDTFEGEVIFTGGEGATATLKGMGAAVSSITPNPVDLASPPPSFNVTGNGFANFGYGLPVVNFYLNGISGTLLAQARASSGTSTTLTVPFPTTQGLFGTLPGLRAGTITVRVQNQTGASQSWSDVGTTLLTVNDSRPGPGVSSITPNPVDLASPPASFTLTGAGVADFGYGLPVANFYRNGTLLAQARSSSGNSTTLTVPFPSTKGLFGTLPGLSAGPVTVDIINQTGKSKSWSVVGSIALTVNDTRGLTASTH
jgi:hypothetical protein